MSSSFSPRDFVSKWQQSTLKERSSYQEHFIDICRLIGHQTPAELDPQGQFFTFEAGASKISGSQGWADVWFKGHFAWEYKGKHANLDNAYKQLLQYRESLQNPPLLIVSDIDQIIIHTNFTNTVKQVYTIELEQLLKPENLSLLRSVIIKPYKLRAPQTTKLVTEEAASQFARIAEILRAYGEDPYRIAHYLIRLLFCLFAEDVSLLPENLFTRLVERSRTKPQAFTEQLRQLFSAMSSGGWFGPEEIFHFDGRLFDDDDVIELDSESLNLLSKVTNLDWSSIEPSIFGTLFERSLDPGKRAQLGAHYTDKDDILLIVEPVLMSPLRHQWEKVQSSSRELAQKRDLSKGGQRTKIQNQLASLLIDFAHQLSLVKILDPACGSGNFLYVALLQLLDLWKEVSTLSGELGLPRIAPALAPSPAQLHGIELNSYAHQLAQATIWIGYIQWFNDNGFGFPSEPILKPLDNILHIDAILTYDESDNPTEPEWPEARIIIGNPPFLGDKKMRAELGDKYVDDLRNLYSRRIPGQSDLVCYWFEKARAEIEKNRSDRAGLLATQGIRGGANRTVLDRIKSTGDIFWAQSDRDWILDGATVHVSMIGFDRGNEQSKFLDDKQVSRINANLTSSVDVTLSKPLLENSDLAYIGTQKGGKFDISTDIAQEFIASLGNPNGLPNSDVIRPWINVIDITRRPRNMFIIDFGVDLSEEEASQYQAPFEYLRKKIKPLRENIQSEKRSTARWWLHQRPRPKMRNSLSTLERYIATPRVSKYRLFVWIPLSILPDSQVVVFARDDEYFLGVLQSKIHELWSRSRGTQLRDAESGFRYTPLTCFETFPFPWSPGQEPNSDPLFISISNAARELVNKRDTWLNPSGAKDEELKKRTLTNLYNLYPTWLEIAHRNLDFAVFDAYVWPRDIGDEEILERLLALNFKRASDQ